MSAEPGRPEAPAGTSEAFAKARLGWNACAGLAGAGVLRLDILRALLRAVHSERSRSAAAGKKEPLGDLRACEDRLELLRARGQLGGELDFDTLFRSSLDAPATEQRDAGMDRLFAAIERQKLERYDRKWEWAIAREAFALGWEFWLILAWVKTSLAEDWNSRLASAFWPRGVLLLVESGEAPRPAPQEPGLWKGRWIATMEPGFNGWEKLRDTAAGWPGTPGSAPESFSWSRLFPSPAR
jgi:hypothetical protein